MATGRNTSHLERWYSLSELREAGFGTRHTLTRLISNGSVPAAKIAGGYKIRERDLPLLAGQLGQEFKPEDFISPAGHEVAPTATPHCAASSSVGEPTLGDYLQVLAEKYSAFTDDDKAALDRLLFASA